VRAFGSAGAVTGQDGGLPGLDRHSGAVILDDAIKPDDAHSDSIRARINRNYEETIRQRLRSTNVPMISIAQRIHEDDLSAFALSGNDLIEWTPVVMPAMDESGNALNPALHTAKYFDDMREKSPYVFASQYQQDPIPAGGGLFKPKWFAILDDYPDIKTTFVTVDTAESSQAYADATVFSFWGLYEIEAFGRKTGTMGLHWIDCWEMRIEPKDLKDNFLDFWQECNRFRVQPQIAAIEKKSTGVTLVSVLDDVRGITIRDIGRTAASGSKSDRFIRCQSYVANKQISISEHARHKDLVIEHMSKITANNTHKHDDIADTLVDAVQIALIDKTINTDVHYEENASNLLQNQTAQLRLRTNLYGYS
jgi:predicted phage terminase large subunit-like protein